LLEALRFTSGVSNCSNTRVTFKKIHNSRFTIARMQTFVARRIESDAVRDRGPLCGYRFMDARVRQNSLRMTAGVGGGPLGKQCMSGVDPIATMRQHARHVVKSSHFLPGDAQK
jgi:hypothetical protein